MTDDYVNTKPVLIELLLYERWLEEYYNIHLIKQNIQVDFIYNFLSVCGQGYVQFTPCHF